MSKLGDILNHELTKTTDELIRNYNALGLRASGNYEKSLEVFIEEGTTTRAGIKAAHYAYYMENGRGPNQRQDRGMIAFIYVKLLEWMKVKGVTDINPWMAARKIVREGIKVPNKYNRGGVISDVINDKWIDDLQGKILEAQSETFLAAVRSAFLEPVNA